MCLALIEQVATAPMTPTDSSDTSIVRERYEPGVHTINNANPYQEVTVTESHVRSHFVYFRLLQTSSVQARSHQLETSVSLQLETRASLAN